MIAAKSRINLRSSVARLATNLNPRTALAKIFAILVAESAFLFPLQFTCPLVAADLIEESLGVTTKALLWFFSISGLALLSLLAAIFVYFRGFVTLEGA
jgi:hypothetical protein